MSGIMNGSMMTDAAIDEVASSKYMLDDLQLAAELGKTLLERNKALEQSLKQKQTVIEDQAHQIEYLNKQTTALREVNDSRLRIYENLEVNINDLEKANLRLLNESSAQKKTIKSLTATSDTLDGRCDELAKQLADCQRQNSTLQRKNEKLHQERVDAAKEAEQRGHLRSTLRPSDSFYDADAANAAATGGETYAHQNSGPESLAFAFRASSSTNSSFASSSMYGDSVDGAEKGGEQQQQLHESADKEEEFSHVVNELNATRRQCKEEQQRVNDLEDQLNSLIQENQTLAKRIQSVEVNNEIKSMQEELSILDDVRYGKLCSRCLRSCNSDHLAEQLERLQHIGGGSADGDADSYAGTEDGDDNSMLELNSLDAPTYTSSVTINVKPSATPSECSFGTGVSGTGQDDDHAPSPNLYRDLMDKYEAVLEVQRQTIPRSRLLTKSGLVTITSIPPAGGSVGDSSCGASNTSSSGATAPNTSGHDLTSSSGNSALNISAATTAQLDGTATSSTSAAASETGRSAPRTPTADFSEAETSSSGFADETSNKHTQTDETLCLSLCGSAGGADGSEATAADAMDGRFRTRPEYRDLFREIFAILKRAADNKDAGEQLPLLDAEDQQQVGEDEDDEDEDENTVMANLVAESAAADGGMYCDDTESVVSSVMSEQSVAMSERITKQERRTIMETVKKHCEKSAQAMTAAKREREREAAAAAAAAVMAEQQQQMTLSASVQPDLLASTTQASAASATPVTPALTLSNGAVVDQNGRVLTPFKRDQLEYLSISVQARKKSRRKQRSNSGSCASLVGGGGSVAGGGSPAADRSDSPVLPSPPRVFYAASGRKRRDMRSTTIASAAAQVEAERQRALANGGGSAGTSAAAASAASAVRSPNIKWDGTSMTVYNRNYMAAAAAAAASTPLVAPPSAARRSDFKRTSAASQSLHKLFELDLSYAEVLRRADSSKLLSAQQQQNLLVQQQMMQKQQQQQQQQQRQQRKF